MQYYFNGLTEFPEIVDCPAEGYSTMQMPMYPMPQAMALQGDSSYPYHCRPHAYCSPRQRYHDHCSPHCFPRGHHGGCPSHCSPRHHHGCCPCPTHCHTPCHCSPRRQRCFPERGCVPSPGCFPAQPCFPRTPCFPQVAR
jgi:hypothetical protein